MNPEVLNSWKEIAAYLGRGVRTVQRWEQELGLPVRRPRGRERSAVIALKPDLDLWLHNTPQHALGGQAQPSDPERHAKLHVNTETLVHRTQLLMKRSAHMQEMVSATLAITTKIRDQQAQRMREREEHARKQPVLAAKAVALAAGLPRGGVEKRPAKG
jgi:DNA-binding transcriptional regulator YiaG